MLLKLQPILSVNAIDYRKLTIRAKPLTVGAVLRPETIRAWLSSV